MDIFGPEDFKMIIEKKVDRFVGYSGNKPVIDIPIAALEKNIMENDHEIQQKMFDLRMEVLRRALQSGC